MTLTSVKGLCLEKEVGEEMTYWKNDVKMSVEVISTTTDWCLFSKRLSEVHNKCLSEHKVEKCLPSASHCLLITMPSEHPILVMSGIISTWPS